LTKNQERDKEGAGGEQMNTEKEFYTTEDVAKMMDVSTRTVKSWLKDGDLPSFKKGRLVRISKDQLAKFIEDYSGEKRES
jgi:excisionase family DNA binding protein